MKKILAFSLAALLALSMTACSGGNESSSSGGSSSSTPSASTASASAADLAKQMVDATTFNDEMIQISEDVVPNYYNLPDGVDDYCVYLCPTGATVEEISVFHLADGAVADMRTEIERHVDARTTEYESYRPEEIPKLDNAAIVESKDYIAVIIADDTAPASQVFEDALA